MALALSITKAAYDKLPEALQNEYYAKDDKYLLDVPDMPDPTALKAAKDHEVANRKAAEQARRDAESEVARLKSELDTTKSDFDKKLSDSLGEKEAALTKANEYLRTTLVESVAKDIAGDISTAPAIMRKFVEDRLGVDMTGDKPVTVVLDASGKPSKTTVDELKAEFSANKDFATIIKGNKATGGSASGSQPAGRAAPSPTPAATADYSKMTPAELSAHLAAKKETTE